MNVLNQRRLSATDRSIPRSISRTLYPRKVSSKHFSNSLPFSSKYSFQEILERNNENEINRGGENSSVRNDNVENPTIDELRNLSN